MKKSELRQIIREEILKEINPIFIGGYKKQPSDFKKTKYYSGNASGEPQRPAWLKSDDDWEHSKKNLKNSGAIKEVKGMPKPGTYEKSVGGLSGRPGFLTTNKHGMTKFTDNEEHAKMFALYSDTKPRTTKEDVTGPTLAQIRNRARMLMNLRDVSPPASRASIAKQLKLEFPDANNDIIKQVVYGGDR